MNEVMVFANNSNITEPFTTTKIIAKSAMVQHHSVTRILQKYQMDFEECGKVGFKIEPLTDSSTGQSEKIFVLNEEQATLLITYLKNTPTVRAFKKELVRQFIAMRKFLLEKQSAEWQQSRKLGKLARKNEMDIIATKLIPHAQSQGSNNFDRFYSNYSRLVNLTLGIQPGQRDSLPQAYVNAIRFMEHAIENIISLEVDKGTHYKDIYRICKVKCQILKELSFLPAPSLLVAS